MLSTILIVVAVLAGLLLLGVLIDLVVAAATLLRAIATHRDAQASSVLHHAGLLDTSEVQD